jgi:uncharacterized iron-regulated membrane protein
MSVCLPARCSDERDRISPLTVAGPRGLCTHFPVQPAVSVVEAHYIAVRRRVLTLHLYAGLVAAAYVLLIALTGALLVFRIDMQRALYPHLFAAGTGPTLDAATVLERLPEQVPGWRVSGVEAPSTVRPPYLAYVVNEHAFRTLLLDPATGRVRGELPQESIIATLQALHFNLLSGRAGRRINGAGAVLLLVLWLTGLVLWWRAHAASGVRRVHARVGIWTGGVLALWAITGLHFVLPRAGAAPAPLSSPRSMRGAEPSWRELIDAARRGAPGQHVARVVLPATERAAFLVMFSPHAPHSPAGTSLTSVYVDRYTGARLAAGSPSSAATLVTWLAPLHVGNFGGRPVQVAWGALALAPPLLAGTGVVMWWRRARRP